MENNFFVVRKGRSRMPFYDLKAAINFWRMRGRKGYIVNRSGKRVALPRSRKRWVFNPFTGKRI